MGGAASTQAGFEQMLACTMLLGDAMVQGLDPRFVRFPDLYRLYDFHIGPKNPQHQTRGFKSGSMVLFVHSPDADGKFQQLALENGESVTASTANKPLLLCNGDDKDKDEDEDESSEDKDRLLVVYVGKDKVVLDKATLHQPNNDGWTPLHAASHVLNAQEAGIAILKELVARKADLDLVTRRGPGSFSCGWTALHIACAYGLEALALKLVRAGANVNTVNSVGWTPLYDACHRSYSSIARELLRAGARHDVLCPEFALCPFPGQFPLAEAARQGHVDTVKLLLEWGVDKNAANKLGWTALHEASYHSRVAVVKLLVVYGADVLAVTDRGSVAKDLTIHSEIRTMLEDVALHLQPATPAAKSSDAAATVTAAREGKTSPAKKPAPLSRKEEYELLGDLPSLQAISIQDDDDRDEDEVEDEGERDGDDDGDAKNATTDAEKPRKKRRDGSKKKKKHSRGAPDEFKCAVSRKLLKTPLRSPFGQVFEEQVIEAWFRDFGNRCPLTGEPLTRQQLVRDDALRDAIRDWKHGAKKSKARDVDDGGPEQQEGKGAGDGVDAKAAASAEDSELYDF